MSFLPTPLRRLPGLAAVALLLLPASVAGAAPTENPQLTIGPGSHDFGIVELNRGGQQAGFNVQNVGADWAPVSTRISGPDADRFWLAWDGCGGSSLAPSSTCGLGVQFDPSSARDHHATLVVSSGDFELSAELTGTGGLRQVTATPNPVDFGSVSVGSSATRSVTLQNTGNVYFQSMVAIPVGGDVGAFSLVEDGCSMHPLAPTVGCKLKLRFAPHEVDAAEATLAIIGEGEPTLITLRGTGVAASAQPSSASALPRAKKAARVGFNWRRGLPAPYRGNRVDLGVARCVGAPTCRVDVRAWLVTRAAGSSSSGARTTRAWRSTWWVGNGSRVALRLPRRTLSRPARLVVDLRTKASGRSAGVQRLNLRLLEGFRRGGAVVASPTR
jgi:hypothetical protein